jgi:putative DNA primase/helicase
MVQRDRARGKGNVSGTDDAVRAAQRHEHGPGKVSNNGTAAAALRLAGLGIAVVPLHAPAGGGCTCAKGPGCGSIGKHPRTKNGSTDATADGGTVRGWFRRWPGANLGIATGAEHDLFMVGPDRSAGVEALARLEREHGALPLTPRARSGSEDPGRHYYFRLPAGVVIGNGRNHRGLPIDVRGEGGLAVAPPSLHKSGRHYEWEVPPWETPFADPPAWLVDWCQNEPEVEAPPRHVRKDYGPSDRDVIRRAVAYLAKCPPAISRQGGHDQTFAVARAVVYGFDLGPDVGFELLADCYNPRCLPEWSEKELRHKCRDADTRPCRLPRGWLLDDDRGQRPAGPASEGRPAADADKPHLSDTGNAVRFVREHGRDMRHCHPWRKWLGWDGRRWRTDETGEAMRRAKATVKRLYDWAAAELRKLQEGEAEDDKAAARVAVIKSVLAWALKSEAAQRLAALLDVARSELPVMPADLDRDPWLFNCANGTLDLRTARLRPHRREDLLTKLCPTAFDPDANCPVFLRTIDGIFGGDRELTRYVQRFGGYCLTGDVREDVVAIAHGVGSNGKTLLFSALLDTIGPDYSGTVPPELLLETRGEQHPTIKADLFGKRLMVAAETGEGRRLNEERLKALSGRDPVKARRMREDFWEFDPTHKLVLFTNHKPEVRGTDHGIWRRLALWPFGVTFWDADKGEAGRAELRADKGLPEKLRAERPGILAWLVAGCLEWQAEGLRVPEKVKAATAEYRDAQDVLAAFLADCCLTGPNYSARATPLYEGYCRWAKSNNERELSQRRFGDAMTERGYDRYTSDGTWYRGVALRNLDHSVGG